jgi:hypothetical protein
MKILLFLLIGAALSNKAEDSLADCREERNECNFRTCINSVDGVKECKRNCIIDEIICTTQKLNRYNNSQDKAFADAFDKLVLEFREQYNDNDSIIELISP